MTERNTISPSLGPATGPAEPSAGAQLQLAREDAGLTLDAVAQQLKLAPRQVKAIEDDDFAGLPGRTFVRGFVRNYARLLHLDADAVLAALPGGSTPSLDSPALHATAPTIGELPTTERGKPGWTRWVIPLTLVAVIAAAAVYEFSRGSDNQRRAPATPSDGTVPAGVDRGGSPAPAISGGPFSPAPNRPTAQSLPNPLAAKEPAAAQAPAGTAATSTAAGSTPAQVLPEASLLLMFRDSSWTEVKDRSGRILLSQLMAAGQTQTFSGTPPFELVIGNASEVGITYRGVPVDLAPYTRSGVARLTLR